MVATRKKPPVPIYFGRPGHFVGRDYCRYWIHTHVGRRCISTIGDWWPRNATVAHPMTSSPKSMYETMVFPQLPRPDRPDPLPLHTEHYATAEAAQRGHAKWVRWAVEQASKPRKS